jgi:uncharacterized protein (DUF983 family)
MRQEPNETTRLLSGLVCRCPRCGKGHLFQGFLDVKPACEKCALNYSFASPSDAPAICIMLLGGFLVLGFALWLDLTFAPPFWVHLVTTLPIAVVVCLGPLRPLKGAFIAIEYGNLPAASR